MANTINGRHGYVPFRAWLYQHQDDGGSVGVIAHLVMTDTCELPLSQCHIRREYEIHLTWDHHASDEQMAQFDEAWAAYQQYKRAKLEAAS